MIGSIPFIESSQREATFRFIFKSFTVMSPPMFNFLDLALSLFLYEI
jgi:hypothetical protein